MRDVGCALIWNDQGQLLIAQRLPEDSYGGFWEFPGGKKRDHETLEQCTAREIGEELAIQIVVGKLFHHMPTRSESGDTFNLYFFECHYVSGEVQKIEAADAVWVYPKDLYRYDFLPANKTLIDKLNQKWSCLHSEQ